MEKHSSIHRALWTDPSNIMNVYTGIMQDNALEKANVAPGLIAQQKNYAVYETTVLWNLMPNGYEVEEW